MVRVSNKRCLWQEGAGLVVVVALTALSASQSMAPTVAAQSPIPSDEHLSGRRNAIDEIGIQGHGFVRDAGGALTTVDVLGATTFTVVFAINNNGQIVRIYIDDVRRHGFLLSNGAFTTLTIPGTFEDSIAVGIDDQGRIVGLSF
jgi:hypothetical protein